MIASQLFFSGSNLSTQAHRLQCFADARFILEQASTHDHRPMPRAWFDRPVKHREQATALVGLDRTQNDPASYHFLNRGGATLHRLRCRK